MERKRFLKNTLLTATVLAHQKLSAAFIDNNIDELKPILPNPNQVLGFNHLPNKESESYMNYSIHRSETRGHANHGWLNSYHSFSFANYYNPERMHFGVLRVLNDDRVAPGMGFGTHPHDNMEIISIPLEGDLEHKDSMGNTAVIRDGDIQVMSAGTGITHSEYNRNKDKEVRFLQIWLFPNKGNVKPRYDQMSLKRADRQNKLQQVLSPNPEDDGVWIHQNAWFFLSSLSSGKSVKHSSKSEVNGVYLFVLEGELEVNGEKLSRRDAIGIQQGYQHIEIFAKAEAEFLLMDIPMSVG